MTPDFSMLSVTGGGPAQPPSMSMPVAAMNPAAFSFPAGASTSAASTAAAASSAHWRSMLGHAAGGHRHTNSPPPLAHATVLQLTPKRLLSLGQAGGIGLGGGNNTNSNGNSPTGAAGVAPSLSGAKRSLAAMQDVGSGGVSLLPPASSPGMQYAPCIGPSSRSLVSSSALGATGGLAPALATPWASPVEGAAGASSATPAAVVPSPTTEQQTSGSGGAGGGSPLISPYSTSSSSTGSATTVAGSPNSPLTASAGSGFDVLLVEDVRVAQRIAARALHAAHYRVDVASSGEAAVERFRAHRHSLRLVLMDINLPGGISGIDATEEIRRIEREDMVKEEDAAAAAAATQHASGNASQALPASNRAGVLIFGLTGNVDESNLRLYEAAGMNGCIAKGVQLGEAVRQAMRLWQERPGQFVNLAQTGSVPTRSPRTSASPPASSRAVQLSLPSSAAPSSAAPSSHALTPSLTTPSPPTPCSSPSATTVGCGCGCVCVGHCACPPSCACASACVLAKRARLARSESKQEDSSGHNGSDARMQ